MLRGYVGRTIAGGFVAWFLSLLIVALSFGLGVLVGWFLWGSRPVSEGHVGVGRPLGRELVPAGGEPLAANGTPVGSGGPLRSPATRPATRPATVAALEDLADAPRPIDDLIADLVAAPESVSMPDLSGIPAPAAETLVIRDSVAVTATIPTIPTSPTSPASPASPTVAAEPVTEIVPAVQATEIVPAVQAPEIVPAVQATEIVPAVQATEIVPAVQATEIVPAVQATEVITAVEAEPSDPVTEPVTEAVTEAEAEAVTATEPEAGPVAEPAVPRPADPAPSRPDDLRRIEGIGPKLAAALTAAGITTYAQLADADPKRLVATLREQGMRFAPSLDTWIAQARLLAAGDEEGFTTLAAELVAGRRARARR